jgi:DNA-binding CsgD family transcriptional regulator
MYVSVKTLQRAARILDIAADADHPGPLTDLVLVGLAEMIGGDLVTYCEMDAGNRLVCRDYPVGALDPAGLAVAFHAYWHEHPIITHFLRNSDTDPVMISDFLSTRELHRLGLYADYLRPTAIEYQIAFKLSSGTDQVLGMSLCRSRTDFTESERAVLAVLAGPLDRAVLRAADRQRALAALETAAEAADGDTYGLSDRELEVLGMVAEGRTNRAIANSIGTSPRTVAKHLENVYRKLGVTSRAAAVNRVHRRPDALTRGHTDLSQASTDFSTPTTG